MLAYYEERAKELRAAEDVLHENIPPHRKALIAEKRALLFADMCQDAGVPDSGLLDLQLGGTPLSGISGATGLFPEAHQKPAMDDSQLMKSSRWSRKMVSGRDHGAMDKELSSEVWNITMSEVEKGWLQGPMTHDQVREALGPLYIVSPRFGIRQFDKVRPIDDMICPSAL